MIMEFSNPTLIKMGIADKSGSLRMSNPIVCAALAAAVEVSKARKKYPTHNSAHEAFAVLMEEVDELWDCVKMKQSARDLEEMRKEAIQVAAMAIRFAVEICNEERGRR